MIYMNAISFIKLNMMLNVTFMWWRNFVIFFTLRSSDLIITLTYVLMDNICSCFNVRFDANYCLPLDDDYRIRIKEAINNELCWLNYINSEIKCYSKRKKTNYNFEFLKISSTLITIFCYSFSFSSSLFFSGGKRITKVVVKRHAFLLDLILWCSEPFQTK